MTPPASLVTPSPTVLDFSSIRGNAPGVNFTNATRTRRKPIEYDWAAARVVARNAGAPLPAIERLAWDDDRRVAAAAQRELKARGRR